MGQVDRADSWEGWGVFKGKRSMSIDTLHIERTFSRDLPYSFFSYPL